MARTKPNIYIAIPYSNVDRELSYKVATALFKHLHDKGHAVYSPITYTHPIAEMYNTPPTYEYWKHLDEAMVGWCDVMYVVKMDGWKKSNGVCAEVALANACAKDVEYLEYEYTAGIVTLATKVFFAGKHGEYVVLQQSIDAVEQLPMLNDLWDTIHERALQVYTNEVFYHKFICELNELAVVLAHQMEGKTCVWDIIDEIADVEILIARFKRLYDCGGEITNKVNFKMQRLNERMNDITMKEETDVKRD